MNPEVGILSAEGIISAIIIGAIIGILGRLLLPGRQNIPMWLTVVVGIGAALLGTVLASAVGVRDTAGIDWVELFIQLVLAVIGVALVSGVSGRSRRSIT
jgi:uncharacterized membrane protein YeaQ/YmgE (transglycosylase-associated protein family)